MLGAGAVLSTVTLKLAPEGTIDLGTVMLATPVPTIPETWKLIWCEVASYCKFEMVELLAMLKVTPPDVMDWLTGGDVGVAVTSRERDPSPTLFTAETL